VIKRSLILLFFITLIVSPGLAAGEKPAGNEPQKLEFSLPDLGGKVVKLSDYKGRVVMLNFWASWCPPCREEMPAMQKLHQLMAKEPFAIVAVNIERGGSEKIRDFIGKNRLTFKVLLNGDELASRLSIRSIPTTYLIDKKGEVVTKIIGARDWADAENLKMFKEMVKR